jgi:hypothetical protein
MGFGTGIIIIYGSFFFFFLFLSICSVNNKLHNQNLLSLSVPDSPDSSGLVGFFVVHAFVWESTYSSMLNLIII